MTEQTPGYEENGAPGYTRSEGVPAFRHYIGILRRRIWPALTAFVIVATLGTVRVFRATPIYQGVAKILIEKQSPRVMKFEDVVQMQASDRDYHNTQRELIQSRAVLEKALEQPGVRELFEERSESGRSSLSGEVRRTVSAVLGTEPAAPSEPWEKLRGIIKAEQVQGADLLLVKATSTDPRGAALLANAVARSFEEYHLERKLETSGDTFLFLQQQKEEQEKRLFKAEDVLQEYREQAQVISLDVADKENPVLARLSRLNEQLTEVQLQRITLGAQLKVVRQAASAGEEGLQPENESLFSLPAVRADGAVGRLRAKLVESQEELATLSETYLPGHPQLQAAQVRAGVLHAELKEVLTQLMGSLTAELQMLTNQEQELHQQYEDQNRLALELARQSFTFNRHQNEVQRQRKLFDLLVERMGEVDFTSDYTWTNIEVVEAAEVPKAPILPRKGRAVTLSMFLGLLLGIGLAFFFEHLDDTIKTPEDLEERVGMPVLGFVPAMAPPGHAGVDGFPYRGSISVREPTSSVTEAYRNIRTSLFFSAPAEESKVLVVTSSGPGDGKTTCATNLALVIAQSEKRVLLIDADFRKPMVDTVFGLESKLGASNVLVGEASLEEAVQKVEHDGTIIENLDILVAGPKPPNPAELLDSQGMRNLLAEAGRKYDRVILDSPPVLFAADASVLGAIANGVIMVVKSAANTRAATIRARARLEGVKARILGGVLNDVRISRLGYYYSPNYYYYGYFRYYYDYYRSYYGYGSDGGDKARRGEGKAKS